MFASAGVLRMRPDPRPEELDPDNQWFMERYKLLREAKKSINIGAYAFRNSLEYELVGEELCQAVQRGVQLRVIADHYGSNFRQKERATSWLPDSASAGSR
ncbi:MAG: hypothetical protein IT285_13185 [Bdellovibrionales bacterium]|nr:hypothetical protein [Bdellovibrionales bacterium]